MYQDWRDKDAEDRAAAKRKRDSEEQSRKNVENYERAQENIKVFSENYIALKRGAKGGRILFLICRILASWGLAAMVGKASPGFALLTGITLTIVWIADYFRIDKQLQRDKALEDATKPGAPGTKENPHKVTWEQWEAMNKADAEKRALSAKKAAAKKSRDTIILTVLIIIAVALISLYFLSVKYNF